MIKPYQLTRESRYLGLPLGFGFLGVTYALSAFTYLQPYTFGTATMYIQLILRPFAFVFLSVTYLFSGKTSKGTRWIWNTTLFLLIIALLLSFVIVSIPEIAMPNYQTVSVFVRLFNLACLVYICAHTIRSHVKAPDPQTIWIPIGYFMLAVSQYSLIVYAVDNSLAAFWSALAIRWAGFAIFLAVSFRTFYGKGVLNEKDRTER